MRTLHTRAQIELTKKNEALTVQAFPLRTFRHFCVASFHTCPFVKFDFFSLTFFFPKYNAYTT